MGVGDISNTLAKAEADATRHGWVVDRVAGDIVLMRRLLDGDWADDYLVLQPGEQVRMTYDENVIGCATLRGVTSPSAELGWRKVRQKGGLHVCHVCPTSPPLTAVLAVCKNGKRCCASQPMPWS